MTPFETTLRVEGSFHFATEPALTYTGPGVVEFLENPNPNEYNVSITTPGIYSLTVEVTDDQSNIYTDTVAIEVLDLAQLDALLTAKWSDMQTALSDEDIGKSTNSAIFQFEFNTHFSFK